MKKYRLTKITVKTTEIISISKGAQDSVCPLCQQPLSALIAPNESSAGLQNSEPRLTELSPAVESAADELKK